MSRMLRSFAVLTLVTATALLGCESTPKDDSASTLPAPPKAMRPLPDATGFLSTYSRLEQAGPSSLRYINPNNRLARYDKFMLQPVEIKWYHQGVTVSEANQQMLAKAMHDAVVKAMSDRYQIVTTPAWDVGELRVALTDLQRSTPILNAIPRPKITDLGLGGLAMEAEVIDSVSNVQAAALVESSIGRNLSWNPTEFDDAIGAMNDWARRFRKTVDMAHDARSGG
ncbi:MAG: DUF3313 domain-containing protein [Planctomycetes bacterium]|nr:DUF3313 domain-containing protein [Planctomycetota bacterium]